MSAARFNVNVNELLRRAQGAISNFRAGGNSFFLGRNGEVLYSKNNVCVHESSGDPNAEEPVHLPGYLTIHCLEDEQLGLTLVLQWLPNTLLQKNPTSIRCVSPRPIGASEQPAQKRYSCSNRRKSAAGESEEENEEKEKEKSSVDNGGGNDSHRTSTGICFELPSENGGSKLACGERRPQHLMAENQGLTLPSINVIPNTPIEHQQQSIGGENGGGGGPMGKEAEQRRRNKSESSEATSGEDEGEREDEEENARGQSSSSAEGEDEPQSDVESAKAKSCSLDALRKSCAASLLLGSIPEQFAREHNLVLKGEEEDGGDEGSRLAMAEERVQQCRRSAKDSGQMAQKGTSGPGSLFSVNLGKMRSMRVFYSDPERTSGQLVLASPDSQYKIFHFHHAGLDKLAALFEKWNAVKAKSAGTDSPSANLDRHLLICPAGIELLKIELDPEDGLYERLNWDLWRSYVSRDGNVEDPLTIRKTIFFASLEPELRRELWPFLLRIFPWQSTHEQRDAIRNDLFLRYQRLKRTRIHKMAKAADAGDSFYARVESSIVKDVVRTDRRNSFFAGEENTNLEIMKSILMNYAVRYPQINYIQGMSDLLAPLLSTLRDEQIAYWCFGELMKQTLFCQPSNEEGKSTMEVQLDLLRELLRMFTPEFHAYLLGLGGDAPSLMFVHRWILLFFKREFPQKDSLHIWEACWSRYRTSHFHLFIACAIVSVFGPDVVAQRLPHDELLFYFSSLAMHMDARLILRKARGLLHQFHRLPRVPCALAVLFESETDPQEGQWSSHVPAHREFECSQLHGREGTEPCPFSGKD